jgi:hypothetical protein
MNYYEILCTNTEAVDSAMAESQNGHPTNMQYRGSDSRLVYGNR